MCTQILLQKYSVVFNQLLHKNSVVFNQLLHKYSVSLVHYLMVIISWIWPCSDLTHCECHQPTFHLFYFVFVYL